jgi:hypothetical protein
MSTRRTLSTNGMIIRRPGSSVSRYLPKRSFTPRWKGWTILTELIARISRKKKMMPSAATRATMSSRARWVG